MYRVTGLTSRPTTPTRVRGTPSTVPSAGSASESPGRPLLPWTEPWRGGLLPPPPEMNLGDFPRGDCPKNFPTPRSVVFRPGRRQSTWKRDLSPFGNPVPDRPSTGEEVGSSGRQVFGGRVLDGGFRVSCTGVREPWTSQEIGSKSVGVDWSKVVLEETTDREYGGPWTPRTRTRHGPLIRDPSWFQYSVAGVH